MLPMVAGITTYGMLMSTINLARFVHAMQKSDILILFKAFDTREENSKMNGA